MNYYNENDKQKAEWLRKLIACNVISKGEVDERSILEVHPDDLDGYIQCHFFAGIGIWSYALRLAGWPDRRPVWTASCPCQPWSVAGEGKGEEDERHLWPALFRLIRKRRPCVVFGEQTTDGDGITWLDNVQTNMESISYRFGPCVLPAAGFGAPHGRHRTFFVADAKKSRRARSEHGSEARGEEGEGRRLCGTSGHGEAGNVADPDDIRSRRGQSSSQSEARARARDEDGGGLGFLADSSIARSGRLAEGSHGENLSDVGRGDSAVIVADAEEQRGHGRVRARNGHAGPADNGASVSLGNSASGGQPGHNGRDEQQQGVGCRGETGRVDDTERTRLEVERGESGALRKKDGPDARETVERAGSSGIGPANGFWADAEWIPTRGKIPRTVEWRPIKPESLEVDDGTPEDLLRLCDYGFPLVKKSEARTLRLRGYGDGIVAQVACEFIKAYMSIK